MSKSSKRMFLVKVSGIDGYFQTKTGGNITSDVTKVYDGGAKIPDQISGPPGAENVTVTRTYDPLRDGAVLKSLRQQVGSWQTTVSITPTNADFVAVADASVYPNSLLVGLNEPEADSGSGDPSDYGLIFSISSYR